LLSSCFFFVSKKSSVTSGLSFVIPWAIFLGAFAQLFAAIQEAKHNNTFGMTAFEAYGFFWLGVAGSWLMKLGAFGPQLAADIDSRQLGFAFLGYLIFTLFMTIGAMETHKVLFIIFVLIDFLFIGLTLDAFGVAPQVFHTLAAYAELAIAIASLYGCGASVLNIHFGRVFLPLGSPFSIFKK